MNNPNLKYLDNTNLTEEEKQSIRDSEYEIFDVNEFLRFIEQKALKEQNKTYTTLSGVVINLETPHATILSKHMDDLKDEEMEDFKAAYKLFSTYRNRAQAALRSATDSYKKLGGTISEPEKREDKIANKILTAKKAIVIELFGKLYTIKEVFLKLKDIGFKHITEPLVADFYAEHIEEIKKQQEKYKQDYSHLRLTSKTSRVEELTSLYIKLKSKYEKTGGNREDQRVLLQTLEAIRKEVEGDKLTINGQLGLQIQSEVGLHVRQEIMKGVPLKEMIISRVAARSGLNPMDIISELNNSYYAKYNRLTGQTIDIDHEEVELPSLQVYDFEKIKQYNQDKDNERKLEIEAKKQQKEEKQLLEKTVESDLETENSKNTLKNLLLQKLKNSQEGLDSHKALINKVIKIN